MRTDYIIVLGLLSDDVFIKRYKQVRRVISAHGLCETITAGCGMGGGITPKVLMLYED